MEEEGHFVTNYFYVSEGEIIDNCTSRSLAYSAGLYGHVLGSNKNVFLREVPDVGLWMT